MEQLKAVKQGRFQQIYVQMDNIPNSVYNYDWIMD